MLAGGEPRLGEFLCPGLGFLQPTLSPFPAAMEHALQRHLLGK